MRLLSYVFFMVVLSCNNPVKQTADKSKVPESFSVTDMPIATGKELQHSFVLQAGAISVRLNALDSSLSYDSLPGFIKRNRQAIIQQPLNLVAGKGASYQYIVDVLDQMTIHHIKEYKLLRYD
ncbi:MAG: hypothetical protein JWP69_988 [Flaviaesturariibacter sp.]|nr:hypothetical protein [Flaviaesturariibacter sp.]